MLSLRCQKSIRHQIDAERKLKHELLNGRAIRQYFELLERELTSHDLSVEKIAFAILKAGVSAEQIHPTKVGWHRSLGYVRSNEIGQENQMDDSDRATMMGFRAAMQVMFSHLQMKMDLEEQADFKKRIEACHESILADDRNGSSAERKRMADAFSSVFDLPSAVAEEPADGTPFKVIDGGKDDNGGPKPTGAP